MMKTEKNWCTKLNLKNDEMGSATLPAVNFLSYFNLSENGSNRSVGVGRCPLPEKKEYTKRLQNFFPAVFKGSVSTIVTT